MSPGIVYGKGEHGNMTRLYWGQKKHYFVYTGRKDTIKACIYVKTGFVCCGQMFSLLTQGLGTKIVDCLE